jgi:hypothetical protein
MAEAGETGALPRVWQIPRPSQGSGGREELSDGAG